MSGDAEQIHPRTLGIMITEDSVIENQLFIIKTCRERLLRNNSMNAIIESIDSCVLVIFIVLAVLVSFLNLL